MATEKLCKLALDQCEKELAHRKGVVGLGVVSATEDVGGRDCAVAVYVKKKLPETKLKPKDVLPKVITLNGRKGVVKVPVKVIEQGEVELEGRESI